jgi:hypothetical protein
VAILFSFLGFSQVVHMSFYLERFLTRQQNTLAIHNLTMAVSVYFESLRLVSLIQFES